MLNNNTNNCLLLQINLLQKFVLYNKIIFNLLFLLSASCWLRWQLPLLLVFFLQTPELLQSFPLDRSSFENILLVPLGSSTDRSIISPNFPFELCCFFLTLRGVNSPEGSPIKIRGQMVTAFFYEVLLLPFLVIYIIMPRALDLW